MRSFGVTESRLGRIAKIGSNAHRVAHLPAELLSCPASLPALLRRTSVRAVSGFLCAAFRSHRQSTHRMPKVKTKCA
jgi:hypothetical protein